MKSKLSNKGYIIIKDKYSNKQVDTIKKDLNVCPYSPYQSKFSAPPTFPVYQESIRKLYLPRYWALEKLGKPEIYSISEGANINLKFNGTLRPTQEEAIKSYMTNCYPEYGGGILCLGCGQGKCLAKNTPVIMYDGTIKMIQDVKVSDQLMGDDSTPRNVLSIGKGKEMLYDIIQKNANTYTVNESHILSLKCIKTNNIIDIELKDYLKLPINERNNLLGYSVSVEFSYKKLTIDPYLLGCSLVLYQEYNSYNIDNNYIELYNLENNLHIPYNYKCNNRTNRLKLLAGILDSNSYINNNSYVILQKNETLTNDIIYLIKSLGFNYHRTIWFVYNKIILYGNDLNTIPVKNINKINISNINNNLTTEITVIQKNVDDYYGVELDGNHRYLLGDFTVTHNTVIGLNIVSQLKKKTLIIVHKEFLLNQWIERIKMFLPTAQIGRIQAKTFDIIGKDIVIAMLQSLSMKKYEDDAFSSFGFAITDECFVGSTLIKTNNGLYKIEDLYNMWNNNEPLPLIYSYNVNTQTIELKKMTYAWEKNNNCLLELYINNIKIKCTSNHKFLTNKGYIIADNLSLNNIYTYCINEENNIFTTNINNKFLILTNTEKIYDICVETNHNYIVCNNDENGVIVSNCHHISSEVFSRALPKVSFKYTLGLTATPNRADGLQKVFEWFLGSIVYKSKNEKKHNVFIKIFTIDDTNDTYCKLETGYDGKPITARMINNVAYYLPRTLLIIDIIKQVMSENERKMLLLSDRRDHLKTFYEQLTELGYDVGYYIGGMKQKDLDISETKPIILGTFSMSSEALDIPELNTLFMTTPKSNIEQSVGRILRKTHNVRPLIIDIKDDFIPFKNQANKRKTFYKKNKYESFEINIPTTNYQSILDKYKDLHNMENNIIDDLCVNSKEKKIQKQEHINEFMILSDEDD